MPDARRARLAGLLGLALLAPATARAATAHLITAPALLNKVPGDDFRIAPDDDTVSGPVNARLSAPNLYGAASFTLLDDLEGGGQDEIMFVDGTIEYTADIPASTPTDVVLTVTGGELRATAECDWPTLGDQGATLTGGTAHLDALVGSATVSLSGVFGRPGDDFPLVGETLVAAPGAAVIVPASLFGRSGNAYVENVLRPLVPADTTSILLVEFTGTVVGTSCCQGFTTHGVFAAYTTDEVDCGALFGSACGGGGECQGLEDCCAALAAALPPVATAATKQTRRVARRLARLDRKKDRSIERAATKTGKKQRRLYKRATRSLRRLRRQAVRADGKAKLGVTLDPITTLVDTLLALLAS